MSSWPRWPPVRTGEMSRAAPGPEPRAGSTQGAPRSTGGLVASVTEVLPDAHGGRQTSVMTADGPITPLPKRVPIISFVPLPRHTSLLLSFQASLGRLVSPPGVSRRRVSVSGMFPTHTCPCDNVAPMPLPHQTNPTVSSAAPPGLQLPAFQRLSRRCRQVGPSWHAFIHSFAHSSGPGKSYLARSPRSSGFHGEDTHVTRVGSVAVPGRRVHSVHERAGQSWRASMRRRMVAEL